MMQLYTVSLRASAQTAYSYYLLSLHRVSLLAFPESCDVICSKVHRFMLFKSTVSPSTKITAGVLRHLMSHAWMRLVSQRQLAIVSIVSPLRSLRHVSTVLRSMREGALLEM